MVAIAISFGFIMLVSSKYSLSSADLGLSLQVSTFIIFLGMLLFIFTIVALFYIHYRRGIVNDQNATRAKYPIIIEVLGLSCGFLIALFATPIVGPIIGSIMEGVNNFFVELLMGILYFIFVTYSGLRISHHFYNSWKKY